MVKRLDKDDFTRLVLQNQTAMFRTARAIVSTDEDAEDAVQSAICTAFTKLDALRDPAKFKSWILRIVVNNCYDLCRKYRPITDLSEVQNFLPADDPDPTERLSLWEAVLSLNPEMLRGNTVLLRRIFHSGDQPHFRDQRCSSKNQIVPQQKAAAPFAGR